jgi:saccharopine dehydrogenase-like NADP-dependent oxidoreductase
MAASLLAGKELVTEIGLASRNLDTARHLVKEIGSKARPVCVDIQDLRRLSSIAAEYDMIVNCAGPTSIVQVPAVQAAIEAGVHYCDLGVTGRPANKALELDAQARAKGVTIIIGTGWCAVTGMMAVHANHQLDQTDEITTCLMFDYSPGGFFSPEEFLARARQKGQIETSGIDLMEGAMGPVWMTRAGRLRLIEPVDHRMEVLHPLGKSVVGYPTDTVESVSLPRYLPGVKNISSLMCLVPPPLNELFVQQGQRISEGEIDPSGAMWAFFEAALEDSQRWLTTPPGYPTGWWMWATAAGSKNEQKTRYMCWPEMIVDWTNVPLVIIAMQILRGEVPEHGVMPPEACFNLVSFFEEAAKYVPEEHRGKPLFNDRFDWLERLD